MELAKIKNYDQLQSKFVEIANKKTWAREIAFAKQAFDNSTYMQDAQQSSILRAIYNVAACGLSLNPVLQQAYLVPRFIKGTKVVCLEPSFQGLVKLITDSGSVKNIVAYVVRNKDIFEYSLGSDPKIKHIPEGGELIKVYAIATLHDGSKQIEVMEVEEIHKIREMSESYKAMKKNPKINKCVWTEFEPDMWRKTVLKKICKYLPKTDRFEKVQQAISIDNEDYRIQIDSGYYDYLYNRIQCASIPEESRDEYTELLQDCTLKEAQKIESYLDANATDFREQIRGNETVQAKRVNDAIEYDDNKELMQNKKL